MRGVAPLFVLTVALCLAGAASAAASSSDDMREALPLDVRDLLRSPTPFDLLLFPDALTGAAGLDQITATELPGPNAPLSPDLDFLVSRVGTLHLPALPGVDPLAGLATASPQTTGAPVTTGSAFDASIEAATSLGGLAAGAGGSDAAAAQGPSSATDDEALTTSGSASATNPSTVDALRTAWDDLGPAAKTAVGAGALGLLLFGPLAMYSRIKRDDALKNKTRRTIYDIVEANPSLCIKDVADRAGVSYSTASYHLDRLVKTGFLVASEQGNKVCYYKNGGTFSRDERDLVPILKNEECMRVFNHILENPWCYRAEVAQALGVSHTTVNWHLKRLTDAGLVDEHREGRNCHLFIDQPALDRILSVLDKMEQVGVGDVSGLEQPVAA